MAEAGAQHPLVWRPINNNTSFTLRLSVVRVKRRPPPSLPRLLLRLVEEKRGLAKQIRLRRRRRLKRLARPLSQGQLLEPGPVEAMGLVRLSPPPSSQQVSGASLPPRLAWGLVWVMCVSW